MVEWRTSPGLTAYPEAEREQLARVEAIARGEADELVWLLEHPPLYTAGASAKPEDLVDKERFPVYETRRGGQYTYHGPGQRIGYLMLDLNRRRKDVRAYVWALEEWIIRTLRAFDVEGERRSDRVGVWVALGGGREAKIAAIGVRLKRWVAFHGVAINVAPELSHFDGIVPCGVREHGVTSLAALGREVDMNALDAALKESFNPVFDEAFPAIGPLQR